MINEYIGTIVGYKQLAGEFAGFPDVLPAIVVDLDMTTYIATLEVFGPDMTKVGTAQGMGEGEWNLLNNYRS
jgi:hypothetical protein